MESPCSFHGIAERTGHDVRPIGAAENIESSLAAVGHRDFVAVDAEFPAGVADGRGHLGGSGRAFELVDRRHHPHPVSLVGGTRPDVVIPDSLGRVSDMSVTVRIPTTLRPLSGGNATVQVEGATLRDVLTALDAAHPGFKDRLFDEQGNQRRFVNLFVADDDVRYLQGLDTPVPAGETVSIIPAVAGG
jgi:molybdopterin synthase sulfur carrier subunit